MGVLVWKQTGRRGKRTKAEGVSQVGPAANVSGREDGRRGGACLAHWEHCRAAGAAGADGEVGTVGCNEQGPRAERGWPRRVSSPSY